MATVLLKRGAQVDLQNSNGASALIAATVNGHCKVVGLLLQNGAKPDLVMDGFIFSTTVLIVSSLSGDYNITKLLLHSGAQVNKSVADGFSPLMAANTYEVAKLLLEHDATLNVVDRDGFSPLYYQKKKRSSEVFTCQRCSATVKGFI